MAVVPLNDPSRAIVSTRSQIDEAISRVLSSGWVILGPENEALTEELSRFLGIGHTVLVGNGTDALELSLRALGVGPGSRVLTVANAGGYTSTAVRQLGAIPVYVDIDPVSLQMSLDSLKSALSSLSEKPAAIVVTHLFGYAAPIREIVAIAREHGLPVLEDCAQSLGAELEGQRLGTFGDIATTSFYPTKNLGALGDGGAVFTQSSELADRVRTLRQYGWTTRYHTEVAGGRNSRLDEMQAAILRMRLPLLPELTRIRQEIHQRYRDTSNSGGMFPHEPGSHFVAHLAVMITDDRDRARQHLEKAGVKTDIHYPVPDHRQPAYDAGTSGVLAVTEEMAGRILTVPLFPEMTESEIDQVVEALRG